MDNLTTMTFGFSAADEEKIIRASQHGILIPEVAMIASRWAQFPFYILCAVLWKETGGGRNVFGGDNSIFEGHHNKAVTQDNYRAYAIERDATGKAQGVGPMQLTYPPLQRQADDIGGCWNVMSNVLTGTDLLNKFRKQFDDDYAAVFEEWNGAASYGQDMVNTQIPNWKVHILEGV